MIRNSSLRRFVVATTLFLGLFTQFQAVFACELKDTKLQFFCCCDEAGEMPIDNDMSMECDMGGGCNDPAGPVSSGMNCCEASYQPAPSATAIVSELNEQLVLLLDEPQPPPILTSFDLQTIPASSQTAYFPTDTLSRVTGTQTYLLTQRLRI